MNAPVLVFRFRVFIFVLLYFVGFFPPWDFRSGSRGTLWLAASTLLARTGWIGLAAATLAVTLAALACLVAGTILRVWGTAYIGSGVMSGFAMRGDVFVASGPYRYVRNPLYLGAWLLALGVSILMPPSGAASFLLAFSVFVLILISAEERFLVCKTRGSLPAVSAPCSPSVALYGGRQCRLFRPPAVGACSFCGDLSNRDHALLRDPRLAL